jgi:hypothetical protein
LQTWFVAGKAVGRIEAISASGVDTLPDELALTGNRCAEHKAGRLPSFYRSGQRGKWHQ